MAAILCLKYFKCFLSGQVIATRFFCEK